MRLSLGTPVAVLLSAVALAGCGASHRQPMARFALGHVYSVRQAQRAFAAQGVHLRNVTPKDFRGLVAFLDGRPSHAVFLYVIQEGCKCALPPPIHNASRTRHGNVLVLWLRKERPVVRAALRSLH